MFKLFTDLIETMLEIADHSCDPDVEENNVGPEYFIYLPKQLIKKFLIRVAKVSIVVGAAWQLWDCFIIYLENL